MSSTASRKCLCCNEMFHPDARNRRHQRYCAKDACRKASKAARQARWLAKPQNRDYFRGAANCERVRQWRLANPGYSRGKTAARPVALQDDLAPCIRIFISRGLDILGRHAALGSVQAAQPDLSAKLTQAAPRQGSGRIGVLAHIPTGA